MRPIDADELQNYFWDNRSKLFQYKDCIIAIENAPTIDAVPVRHGQWEMKPDPYGFFDEIPVCSECGCTTEMRKTYKYCPNCGAKMDVEEGSV